LERGWIAAPVGPPGQDVSGEGTPEELRRWLVPGVIHSFTAPVSYLPKTSAKIIWVLTIERNTNILGVPLAVTSRDVPVAKDTPIVR